MTAFWRFKGFIEYYTGKRDWGKMENEGSEQRKDEAPVKQFETYQLKIEDEAS